MNNILVVCVGNICRSPVAEGLFKLSLPHCKVWSAGLAALVGQGADPLASQIALEHGVDISAHRAQQISGWMLSQADLVLVMERGQQRQLQQQYPLAHGKIHRLGEYGANNGFDVADPYQQARPAFEAAHDAISRGASQWVNRIQQLA